LEELLYEVSTNSTKGAALFLWKALGSNILKQSCGGQESMEEEKSFTEQSSQRKWYLI